MNEACKLKDLELYVNGGGGDNVDVDGNDNEKHRLIEQIIHIYL